MAKITFKGQEIQTNGNLPNSGEKAKDFTLVNQNLEDMHLKNFAGKKKILITVPSLDTSVCLQETKHLNDLAKKYPQITFIVVSADLPFAQKRICKGEDLNNVQTLSMMRSKDFAKDYGILMTSGSLAGLAARSITLLDEDDTVVYTQLVPEIAEEPNYQALEDALKKM
ncbi:MAG: thiol peroxidase [Simkaniaceae bacterium]